MNEAFIGGFRNADSGRPPALPPKDYPHGIIPHHHHFTHHDRQPQYHAPPPPPSQDTITPSKLTHMTAIERSKMLRIARMEPNLQVRPRLIL